MAWIFRPNRNRGGKVTRDAKWYVRYRDVDGKLRVRVGYADKPSTVQLGARLEREVAQRREGIYIPDPKENSPTALLPVYVMHLRAKGSTPAHVDQTEARLRKILEMTGDKLDAGRVSHSLLQLRAPEKGERPISIGTSNHYLRALKAFGWWLADFRGWPTNPMRKLKLISSEAGKRIRRALSHDDLHKLINCTESSAIESYGLSGVDRSMLYLIAASTGLRASELASLTRDSFTRYEVSVDASYAKNRRRDTVPIPDAVAKRITRWLKSRPASQRLWPGQWVRDRYGKGQSAAMLRADLQAVGIPYKTAAGVFDFHSLRVQYVTNLARAGVPLVQAQRLARHSSP